MFFNREDTNVTKVHEDLSTILRVIRQWNSSQSAMRLHLAARN